MKCSLVLSSLLLLGAASLAESRPFPLDSLDLGGASGGVSRALGRAKKVRRSLARALVLLDHRSRIVRSACKVAHVAQDIIVVDVDDDHRRKKKNQNQKQNQGKGKKKGGESTRRGAGLPS
ncbi:hypothetical protein JCM1841_003331 [Sporobolomyces salmonicolor]